MMPMVLDRRLRVEVRLPVTQDADSGVPAVRAADVAILGLIFSIELSRLEMTGTGAVARLAGYGRHSGRGFWINEAARLAKTRGVASEAFWRAEPSFFDQYLIRMKMCAVLPAVILPAVALPAGFRAYVGSLSRRREGQRAARQRRGGSLAGCHVQVMRRSDTTVDHGQREEKHD
jgi:hypothetical protein